ncbi:MerR family transcriptional regulator [Salinibacterium sp. NYA9b]
MKYYQREGLFPEGVRSAPNQVEYEELHAERVRLTRALLETAGLSIAATKDIIRAPNTKGAPFAEIFSVASYAMGTPRVVGSLPRDTSRGT